MKKVLSSVITAGLALLSVFSCVKEEEKLIFDPADVVAPVAGSYDLNDNGLFVNYTPAQFPEGIQKASHGIVLTKVNGKAVETALTTAEKEKGVLSVSKSVLNKALSAAGASEGSCSFSFLVRAALEAANFSVDSKNVDVSSYELPAAQSNPWADFTEVSAWGVTGSIESVGFNWDKDITMYTDGSRHVARNVKLTPADQFKFRKDHAWGENFGGEGDVEPFVCELGTEYPAVPGGKNLGVAAEGVYDLLLDTDAGTFTVTEAFVTYPGYDQTSPWGVTGAIESMGINWDKDIAMTTNGEWHVAEGVELKTTDQFKFRKDQAWGENFGAEGDVEPFVCNLDEEYPAAGGGKNLAVPADGVYDLLVNPDAKIFKVVESLGGKSGLVGGGGDDPGPEPEPVTGWNIIGLNGDWDNDVLATENNGIWTAYITAEDNTAFKWRKDGDWAENYGGVMAAFGEPFEAVPDGSDISVPAGVYKVELNLTDASAPTITVYDDFTVWSLIGVNGDWDNDIDMTLTDGKWVSPATKMSGKFKIRLNHSWASDRGGTLVALGEPFAAEAGGADIELPAEDTYVVTYDPEAETILIETIGWGLVGTINNWGNAGPDIPMKEEGLFMVAKGISLSDSDEIKVRYNQSWTVNRGGVSAVGVPVKVVQDGDNFKVPAGTYDVYYRPDCEVVIVNPAGEELSYWGVVGTINGWNPPDLILYQNTDGTLIREDITITASDAIKIRMNEAWTVNRGGTFGELGTAFAVAQDDPNISVGRDAVITLVYDPASETITITGDYTGEAPSTVWSLIGVNGDWDNDIDMTLTDGKWVSPATKMSGKFKIRLNHSWASDRGGTLVALGEPFAAEAGGADIELPAEDTYVVTYDPEAETIVVDASGAVSVGGITIDGNFDDWADIPGATPADAFNAFKVWNDADNFYFYVETDPGSRLWSGGAYLYLYFNYKNDLTQGAYGGKTGMGDNKYDAYIYMYLFGGSADAPEIVDNPNNGTAEGMTMDNIVIAGNHPATSSDIVKMEIVIPRANFTDQVNAGDVIEIDSYRSKDGGIIYFPGYVVK